MKFFRSVISRSRPVSSAAWPPEFGANVAIGMVRMTHWDPGPEITVETTAGVQPGVVQEKFWS